jgi:FixJ family two-component response regulator
MDGHVAKPIEASRLFEAIERALAQAETAKAEWDGAQSGAEAIAARLG